MKYIRTYLKTFPSGKRRNISIFACIYCKGDVKIPSGFDLNKHGGKCRKCQKKSRPYEALYNIAKRTAKEREIDFLIPYEDFLNFIKIKKCTYCDFTVHWSKFLKDRKKRFPKRSNLDRKNSKKPYTLKNCVICCWRCNMTKGDRFSYKQFLKFKPILKTIRRNK